VPECSIHGPGRTDRQKRAYHIRSGVASQHRHRAPWCLGYAILVGITPASIDTLGGAGKGHSEIDAHDPGEILRRVGRGAELLPFVEAHAGVLQGAHLGSICLQAGGILD
jgi:hypothetical protein